MLNYENYTLNLKRIEVCDLLLACLAAQNSANDGGKKWERLHDEIKKQLEEQDSQRTTEN